MDMVTVGKEMNICAAHWLPFHEGKCRYLHGHNYKIEIQITGHLSAVGFVMDFGHLKAAMEATIGKWDHALLTHYTEGELERWFGIGQSVIGHFGIVDISRVIPLGVFSTAENLSQLACRYVRTAIQTSHPEIPLFEISSRIWETPTSWVQATLPWWENGIPTPRTPGVFTLIYERGE